MYDMIIVGCGPSSYSFLKGLEKNKKFHNKNIALICPSKYKENTKAINISDVSPKFLQKNNLLSLSYYLFSLKNIITDNFTAIGIHGIGGMARIYGGSIGTFDKYSLKRNNLNYDEFMTYYDEMKSFLPYTGNEDDLLMLDCNIPKTKSITISDRVRKLFGQYANDRFKVAHPRLLVKNSCNNCNQCLIGCHNDSVWYPNMTDFKNIENIELSIVNDAFVERIDTNTISICDEENKIQVLKTKKIILSAGVIQNYKLLAQSSKIEKKDAKLYTTSAISFAFLNFTTNKTKNFFGMGNATFMLEKDKKTMLYGNLYDGYSLSVSKGLVFSSFFLIDKIYKMASRYMVAGAGFMSSDNTKCSLSYENDIITISGKYTKKYNESIKYAFLHLKLFTKEIKSIMLHLEKTKIGGDIHYAGGIPQELYDKDLIVNGKLKNLDDVLVLGGSTFSYLPPQSPTLSFMANSYRIGKNL